MPKRHGRIEPYCFSDDEESSDERLGGKQIDKRAVGARQREKRRKRDKEREAQRMDDREMGNE